MSVLAAALTPFVGALLLAWVPNNARNLAGWLAGLITACSAVLLALDAPVVLGGGVVGYAVPWLVLPGADLGFRLDGLALLFAALVLGVGLLVILYARYYLAEEDPMARFYALLMLFMGAMLGLVLADNLILLVVFWELTSLSSFLLIGFWKHLPEARKGARMALTITGAGGLALLAGSLLLGHIAGSYKLDVVLAAGDAVRSHALYLPTLLLVLAGAFAKSAQFPLHFWLPHAMSAPTPVSAYLHSATMVKAGVFLLARLHPVLAGTDTWFYVVSTTGMMTLVVGAYFALFQHDLKGLLAYSTVSHLGLITLLFGLDEPLAVVAGIFHILNHATFKASLFMAAGILDHECGTRDMRRLNGLWSYMPYTATLAMTAAAAMAGVPLLNGFLSKEMFFAETLGAGEHGIFQIAIPLIATLAGMFAVAYSLRFIHDVFFNGEPVGLSRIPHEPPRWMKMPVEALTVVCLAVGILPQQTIGTLLAAGARATLGGELPGYSLAIWHGFNSPLAMSAVAFAGGLAIYFGLQRWLNLHSVPVSASQGKAAFDALMGALLAASGWIVNSIANRSLQRYLMLLVLAAVIAGAWPMMEGAVLQGNREPTPSNPIAWALWLIAVAAVVATAARHRQRLQALVLLGIAGLLVGLSFVYYSAPDLALTQILVEVVSIILMMLALHYLPQEGKREPNPGRALRDLVLAVAAGGGVAALCYAMLTRQSSSIAGYFLEKTVPEGGGSNAVNVIIVDFRGFDTLGEITVLAVAALAVFAVLERFVPKSASAGVAQEQRHAFLLQICSRLLLPMAVLVSTFLFLRGHNLPGGGFIAGLVLAVALLIQYVAGGSRWAQRRMSADFHLWIGAGLSMAGVTGLGSWWFAHPFLTSAFVHPFLPLVGEVPIASAMFFDLGVYLTVVGATMVALGTLGKVSRRAQGEVSP
jgi:multicomponent K+:H+ antiporter subunit A